MRLLNVVERDGYPQNIIVSILVLVDAPLEFSKEWAQVLGIRAFQSLF